MNTTPTEDLTGLLDHPDVWRAGRFNRPVEAVSSGFAALDEHLPGGGWPRAGLAEFLLPTSGVGELRLLAPLMRALSHGELRWLAWINPPFIPYAPALERLGIDLRRILLIHPKNHREALWALERASRSGTCSLALAWLDERQLKLTDTRRLQIAARHGRTLSCLFRPESAAAAHSMAELRVRVAAASASREAGAASTEAAVTVDLHKRRGGWPVSGIRLQLGHGPSPAEVHEQIALWRKQRRRDVLVGDRPLERAPTQGKPSAVAVAAPRVTH